jgi:DNA-binding CsgD family transcriptional regulator
VGASRFGKTHLDCLRLVAEGKSSKAIGRQLDLSQNTVDSYMRDAISHFGVGNRIEAANAATRQGLLDATSTLRPQPQPVAPSTEPAMLNPSYHPPSARTDMAKNGAASILVVSILANMDTLEAPGSKADQDHGFRRQAHTRPEKLVTRAASAMMKAASNWVIAYLLAGCSINLYGSSCQEQIRNPLCRPDRFPQWFAPAGCRGRRRVR